LSFSASSDTSTVWLRRLAWKENEEANGLRILVSDKDPAFCRRLGRRKRLYRNGWSSEDAHAPEFAVDDGKAKSEDDVGSGVREDVAFGITIAEQLESTETAEVRRTITMVELRENRADQSYLISLNRQIKGLGIHCQSITGNFQIK